MRIRPIGCDLRLRRLLPRRHVRVRPFGCVPVPCRTIPVPCLPTVEREIIRFVEHRPRPPFSLSGTIQVLQFSNTFGHFSMGELLLALLLRSRTEWSRRYPLPLSEDLIILPEGGAALPLAAQVNQIADNRLHSVPTTGQGASGEAVGTRLDLLA